MTSTPAYYTPIMPPRHSNDVRLEKAIDIVAGHFCKLELLMLCVAPAGSLLSKER